MKRSSFIKTAVTAGLTANVLSAVADVDAQKKTATEFYELRVYKLKDQAQQKLVEDYFQQAAIPALNKLGSKNIGVFTEMKPEGQTRIFVLIPFASLEAFLKVQDNLLKDATYQKAGAAYLQAQATGPAYDRIESSLLQAFASTPKLMAPEKKERFFELRRYESASELTGKKKIEMFNEAGEAAIFKRLNFKPVFFAETLIGEMRPNLTYLITFDNMEDHDAKWKAFGSDPDWKRISSMPEYSDKKNVSRITSTFLVPAPYSQI
ncbi:NIPSNAP family protein [Mucilaginibacter arboris]|uniref:NIPSNAP family containing protein n=1 Tax=Mucilaginibacter arboris TaxID=2682090 RepID=A0A7K1SYG9_9SPHI|nr:NIPSNAP family protein [Mucilaginibacter arboris]MVN22365.1 NIPSNAP family containing protein [Mucilaginibacter arboris]